MGKLIIPKMCAQDCETPLIFLAGPIKEAPNWQDEAACFLLSQKRDLLVASPRSGVRDEIAKYVLIGDETFFSRQREWERYYLDVASQRGAILFWLPGEVEHDCHKSYGAMTRLELGQWMTNYKHDRNVRFCVGSDGKFSELNTIRYDLQMDAPDKDIKKTLEATCREALRLAKE
jgi:hypothetical protein